MFETIFDIETKSFFDDEGMTDPGKLGVSIVSVYHREIDNEYKEQTGRMMSFWEKEIDSMWQYFLRSDRIIGFNSKRFDVPVLKPYAPSNFARLAHFDLLEEIKKSFGHRASLNSVAKATLGELKTDSGVNAINYYRKGDPESLEKLRSYCEADVMITKKVYDFGLKYGYLNLIDYWNTNRKIDVDFGYNGKNNESAKQDSLF